MGQRMVDRIFYDLTFSVLIISKNDANGEDIIYEPYFLQNKILVVTK